MTKPKDNLLVAKFTLPNYQWYVGNLDGRVRAKDAVMTFDIREGQDRQAAIMALTRKGWKIEPFTQSGQQHWRATKSHQSTGKDFDMAGGHEDRDIKKVILWCVEEECAK